MSKTTVSDFNGAQQTLGVGTVFKNAVDVTNGTLAYKMGLRKMPLNSSENGLTTGDVGAAFTLSSANSGGVLQMVSGSGALTATLPPTLVGLNFHVMVTGCGDEAGSPNKTFPFFTFKAQSGGILGIVVDADGVLTNTSTAKGSFCVSGTAHAEDSFDLSCDGTNWHVRGVVRDTTQYNFIISDLG